MCLTIHREEIKKMALTQEKQLFRLEIDDTAYSNKIETISSSTTDLQAIEFELLPPVDISDKRKVEIYNEITEIDNRLEVINARVNELNVDIDRLTNHADGIDYTVAVASGIIAGIIDSVWIGEFSIDRANEWGGDKVDNFVVKIAQSKGYKGDDLAGAVQYLEEQFPIAADKATNDFGGGLQHHLRDFSHHPTPVGLFFSLLTQFTGKVYGTDVAGVFKVAPLGEAGFCLIGKNLPEKLTFGVVNWFFHMISDMAGSSGSIRTGKLGTGLPGPIVSLLKEISALPIFRNLNEKGYKEFSVWISKLFNGTLLGKRDENGNLIEAVQFDLRTEIGVAHELGRQAVPVIVNECIVRGFYFVRRLFSEIKENDIKTVSDLQHINWKNTLPFKNRTVIRMLTISTGTFTAFDVADAAIRSGGFNAACVLRINFVGVGRFAIAIGSDISMGVKKSKRENERMLLRGEQLELLNAKLFYKEADMWIEAENTDKALKEAVVMMDKTANEFADTWEEIKEGSDRRKDYAGKIRKRNKDYADELSDLIEWGI